MKKAPRIRVRFFDVIAVIITLSLIAVFSIHSYEQGLHNPQVRISSPDGTWIYSLDENVLIDAGGPLGNTKISIHDGIVEVINSPCPEKICVSSGPISSAGEWIACLPNRVFVTISDSGKEQPDATTF
jgi:hypothetical protein